MTGYGSPYGWEKNERHRWDTGDRKSKHEHSSKGGLTIAGLTGIAFIAAALGIAATFMPWASTSSSWGDFQFNGFENVSRNSEDLFVVEGGWVVGVAIATAVWTLLAAVARLSSLAFFAMLHGLAILAIGIANVVSVTQKSGMSVAIGLYLVMAVGVVLTVCSGVAVGQLYSRRNR